MSYLFLAIPNFCGSTLIHSLLETCPDVVSLTVPENTANDFNPGVSPTEGNICALAGYRHLDIARSVEANAESIYANPGNYYWTYIKECWEKNWASKNPNAKIKLQKTPTDIFRIKMMLPYFDDLKWIVSVRNPYVYAESIFRYSKIPASPARQLEQICFHVLRVMEIQIENLKLLGDNAYFFKYEDFVRKPEYYKFFLGKWLPGLEQMDFDAEIKVYGKPIESIHDDGEEKLQKFITQIPNIIPMINEYFKPRESLLNHWGYELRKE